MDNYIREIVHFEVIKKEIVKSVKEYVGYYKYEKRKGKCKIFLSIDGIKSIKEQTYVFCLVYKIKQKNYIKEIRTLRLNSVGRIDEKIQLEEIGEGSIVGATIILRDNKIKEYDKEIVLAGYQKERFEFANLIEFNNQKVRTNYQDKDKEKNINKDKEISSININDVNEKEKDDYPTQTMDETNQTIDNKGALENEINEKEPNAIDEIFEKKERIEPFNEKDLKTEWVQIDITDLVNLPLESWLLINNAFLINSYRKYKHLILGRSIGEEILKVGVPDVYYFKESLIANICGFNEFYTCSCGTIKSGEYGYWIIKTTL